MALDGVFQIPGDVYVNGTLRANAINMPDNSVGNSTFTVGDPLDATKQVHQYLGKLSQAGTAVTETKSVHQAYDVGRIVIAYATVTVAAIGAATVTFNVKKNGTSILSGAWVLTNTTTPYAQSVGTLITTAKAYGLNDVFEVTATAAAGSGTLPAGLLVTLVFREGAGT